MNLRLGASEGRDGTSWSDESFGLKFGFVRKRGSSLDVGDAGLDGMDMQGSRVGIQIPVFVTLPHGRLQD